ncbi:MAG: YezD family protein [Acidobacteriota bacterium]|nr:YezD family protein [Acidobacteriota bacterium]
MTNTPVLDWESDLATAERELLRELLAAIRHIRYGSVVMTIHDGRVVEVNKTERIRKNFA